MFGLTRRFNETPAAPPPPGATSSIEEAFQCPKCDGFKTALRTKRDNSGYFIGCLGHPGCNHVIWLPSIIKEIKVDANSCVRCGSKKFAIKFKQMSALAMLPTANTVDNLYISCMVCDEPLRSLLDISDDMVKKTNRPAAGAGGGGTNAGAQNSLGQNSSNSRNTTTSNNRTNNINSARNHINAPRAAPPPRAALGSNDATNRNRNNASNNPGSGWGSAGSNGANGFSNDSANRNRNNTNSNAGGGWGSGGGGGSNNPSGPSTSSSWGSAGNTRRGNNSSNDNNEMVRCTGCNEPATK